MDQSEFSPVAEFFRASPNGQPGGPQYDAAFCEALAQAAQADRASIFRLDETGQSLRLARGTGVEPELVGNLAVRVGEGVCGAAASSRRAINVFEPAPGAPRQDPRIGAATGYHAEAILAAPIEFAGRLFGVLEILGRRGGGPFPDTWTEHLRIAGLLYGAALAPRAGQRRAARSPRPRSAPTPPQGGVVLVGASAPIRFALDLCLKAARANDPVLIQGPSGSGKELAARRIHEASSRAGGPLLAVNCAGLSDTLLESELFGHVAGAFTGAQRARKGRFAAARDGTLFLDEIGDMSPACQAKILRALESGEIVPLGSDTPVAARPRVIAATHQDLAKKIRKRAFREDLYYRLCGIEIRIPSLRERAEDIPLLAGHFAREVWNEAHPRGSPPGPGLIDSGALEILRAHDWPGNVRELRQAIRSAFAMSGGPIRAEHLPERLRQRPAVLASPSGSDRFAPPGPSRPSPGPSSSPIEAERRRYWNALQATAYAGTGRWNLAAAARRLGIPPRTFSYRVTKMFPELRNRLNHN